MRQTISDSEAVELLNESLNALRNLAPRPYKGRQTLCFGEYPNEADCPCTACKIRRILNRAV
jgi:hypothetical protein